MVKKECIEREAMLKYIDKNISRMIPDKEGKHPIAMEVIRNFIATFDTADVTPVKRGKWKGYTRSRFCGLDTESNPIYRDGVVYCCSECRRRSIIKTNFCPNCGARMDGGT